MNHPQFLLLLADAFSQYTKIKSQWLFLQNLRE